MKKIQYSIYQQETGNAGGKAKGDCLVILENMGFEHLYHPCSCQILRVIQQALTLSRLSMEKEQKLFVLQYPAVHSMLYGLVTKAIHKNDIGIAIIHDILSLQYEQTVQKLQDELNFLNKFKYVVVPNEFMEKFLEDNGLESHIINMEIYDYLHDASRNIFQKEFSNSICFAGNLRKSTFLNNLNQVSGVDFVLYGADGEKFEKDHISYKGCLPSDELIYLMEGDYGLVWDGSSLSGCVGTVGRYLLYNSPHKLSSYISAGKPVITWKKAAIAKFITDNHIGIVVDSLKELTNIDLKNNYDVYRSNVLKVKKRIADGKYLHTAIERIYQLEGIMLGD